MTSLLISFFIVPLFLLSLFLCFRCYNCTEGEINFFGKVHNFKEWRNIQTHFDRLMNDGVWIKKGEDIPYYHKLCIQEGPYFTHFYIGPRNYGACFGAFANTGEGYIWRPKEEPMLSWSPSHMCEVMNGRNMLIVGDSISQEFFFSILSAMLARVISGKTKENDASATILRKDLQRNTCSNLCDWNKPLTGPFNIDCGDNYPPFRISFAADNKMDGHSFPSRIQSENISLLMINVGAHYQDNATVIAKIRHALSAAYDHNPFLSVVWRNTYAGHKHCKTHFRSPPSAMHTTEELDTMNFTKEVIYSASYMWEEFDKQNELIREMLSTEFPAVFYLDVAAVMRYRHDSHPSSNQDSHDCLHYCLPGPLDSWVGFLYNVLAKASLSSPSPRTQADDAGSILAMTSDKYTDRDGLILKAKHYDMYFVIERGVRHYISDPYFINFLDHMHLSSSKTFNPNDISQLMIRTIDEDEEMYDIPASNPV